MRANANTEEQRMDYQNFNKHFGDVYNMIQEVDEQMNDEECEENEVEMLRPKGASIGGLGSSAACMREDEPSRKEGARRLFGVLPPKKEKEKPGVFGRLGDKISAGLFKASKMNKNTFSSKQE